MCERTCVNSLAAAGDIRTRMEEALATLKHFIWLCA